MKTLGNIIWVVFGGFLVAVEYVIASFAMFITIIGIPFGNQHFKLMKLAFVPFGKVILNK